NWCTTSADVFQGCASRLTSSTFPADTASRRSARITLSASNQAVARNLSWRISTDGGINIRRQLLPNRHQIEEGRRHCKRCKADEHDRDHGMPNEGHVASKRGHHVLTIDHCLTLPREPLQRIVYPLRNHPAHNL